MKPRVYAGFLFFYVQNGRLTSKPLAGTFAGIYLSDNTSIPAKDAQARYSPYSLYRQTVGGTVTQRKPAGSVKSLKLSQYLEWERKMKEKWAATVMQAGSRVSVLQAHSQCKADIAEQWRMSFGYVDSVLRSPALLSQGVTRPLVTSIACMTDHVAWPASRLLTTCRAPRKLGHPKRPLH